MATQITCIIPHSADPTHRTDGVGGRGWMRTEEEVIGEIEDGANYYIEVYGQRISVIVAELNAHKYLRTDPDKSPRNKLLSLPHCP